MREIASEYDHVNGQQLHRKFVRHLVTKFGKI